jgi:predicted metal-dependent peptidase
MSANIQRLVEEILTPKIVWQDVLRRFMQRAKTTSRTWARPNRRFVSQGLYMPSASGETMGDLVVAVDCSGSISSRVIDEFAAEVRSIQESTSPAALHIIYFDARVCHHDSFGPDDTIHIAPRGGGGTAFSPVVRHIQEQNIQPAACVFLTDLYSNDFGSAPDYPVLWVSNGAKRAPWGEVVAL